jgi:cytochrome c556
MIRTVLAVVAVAVGVTAALAQDPIADRKAMMKKNGAQAKAGAAMARGKAPFDLAKAKAIFVVYAESAEKLPTMFPPNTKTGGETTAAPAIWDKNAAFKAAAAKFAADSKAAAASVKDLDTFKVSFAAVQKNCGACHETFRIKK